MSRKYSIWVVPVFLVVLLAWSPWLSRAQAEALAVEEFNETWMNVIDGCGTSCRGCGVVDSRRVPFGVMVTLEYGCGLMPEDSPKYHERATGFVSALGSTHGFPRP